MLKDHKLLNMENSGLYWLYHHVNQKLTIGHVLESEDWILLHGFKDKPWRIILNRHYPCKIAYICKLKKNQKKKSNERCDLNIKT